MNIPTINIASLPPGQATATLAKTISQLHSMGEVGQQMLASAGLGSWENIPAAIWLKQNFYTQSTYIQTQLFQRVAWLAAPNRDSVMIYGETGTGKELIARALHIGSPGKFAAINVTGLPSELVESELFGHVAGAFTGAIKDRVGLLVDCDTVFLDEIGDMPADLQPKLLRAIQEMRVRPVGSNQFVEIKCRFVSATNRVEYVRDGAFRLDLYWRLATHEIELPPLRERGYDIQFLLQKLWPENTDWSFAKGKELAGNYRELVALVRREQLTRKMK